MPDRRHFETRTIAVLALLVISLALNTQGIDWGLPNVHAWHGDDMCHYTLQALGDGFAGFTKYPLVHHLTLALVYAPYLAWLYVAGALDPGAGSVSAVFQDPVESMTVLLVLSRVVSIVMASATVYLLYRIALRLTNCWPAAWFGAAAYALSSEVTYFAKMISTDTPLVFWFALTMAAYLRFAESFDRKAGFRLGLFVALSVSTKEQIGGAYVLVFFALSLLCLPRRSRSGATHPAPPRWSGFVVLVVTTLFAYALLSKLLIDPVGWYERIGGWLGEGTDPASWGGYPSTLAGYAQLAGASGTRMWQAMGPALLALTVLAACLAFTRHRVHAWRVLLPLLSYLVFTIGAIRYVNSRFLLPVLFLLCLLAAMGMAVVAAQAVREKWIDPVCCGLVAVILGFSAHRCWFVNGLFDADTRYEAEALLTRRLPAGGRVEVYADDHYLPRIEQIGFEREFERGKMREGSFLSRLPHAVVLAPDSWWKLDHEQRQFVDWLRQTRHYVEFIYAPTPSSALLSPEDRQAIQPTIVVLLRLY